MSGALPSDRAVAVPAEPEVSALRASIPSADTRLQFGRKSVLMFHPPGKKVRDGTLRCISCGQLDEDGVHDAAFCPGMGGWLPFATSTLNFKLKADSGYRASGEARLTLEQWGAINRIIDLAPSFSRKVIELAQRIEAGTDETLQAARPEGQEPDPKGCAQ